MGGQDIKFSNTWAWYVLGGVDVEGSRRGEETGMKRVIDGVNESQRMVGDESRGMCMSVAGVGVSVMK